MGTIPTIATFAAGGVVTSAYLNSIKAANDFWALTPRCYAYASAAQSIPNTTVTVINLDTEVYDIVQSGDSPSHDLATNNTRIYCRTSGKYEVTGQVQIATNATGVRTAQIRLNANGSAAAGTLLTTNQQSPLTGASTSVTLAPIEVHLTAGDYVEMFASQTSGGALNTVAGLLGVTFMRMKLTGL